MILTTKKTDSMQAILWRYSDGSSCGVVRIYASIDQAKSDLNMLQQHADGMKIFELVEVPFIEA